MLAALIVYAEFTSRVTCNRITVLRIMLRYRVVIFYAFVTLSFLTSNLGKLILAIHSW